MNIKAMRTMIEETYVRTKWYLPSNFLWAIMHFGLLCRLAMVGMNVMIVYQISLDELERKRKKGVEE